MLPEAIVEDAVVILLHESVDLFVGDEEQNIIDRLAISVNIVPGGYLFDAQLDISEKVKPAAFLLDAGGGIEVFDIVVERKFDIHVQLKITGEEEGKVGPAPARADRFLFAIVDIFDKAGHVQHILGHAFPPLAARLAVDQGFAQGGGGLEQGRYLGAGGLELLGQLAEFLRPVLLEACHKRANLFQLAVHPLELMIDQLPFFLQGLAGIFPLAGEPHLCELDELIGRAREGFQRKAPERALHLIVHRLHALGVLDFMGAIDLFRQLPGAAIA